MQSQHTTETLFERHVSHKITFFAWSVSGSLVNCMLCGRWVQGKSGAPMAVPDPEYDGVFAFDGVVCGRCRVALNDSPTFN